MLNQNIPLKRGAVRKGDEISVRTVRACTNEGGSVGINRCQAEIWY